MDRRVSGGLMLVLALVAALVVPRVLAPPVEVAGTASIAPPPPPPSVGDCIEQVLQSGGFDADGRPLPLVGAVIVPCEAPHGTEVIAVDLDFRPTPYDPDSPLGGFTDPCDGAARASLRYLGVEPTTAGWEPAVALATAAFGPDQRQIAAGQRWAACAYAASGFAVLTASLRDIAAHDAIPPTLAQCHTGDADAPMRRSALCSGPHTLERFAGRALTAGDPTDQDSLDRACAVLVGRAVGRPLDGDPDLDVIALTRAFVAGFPPEPVLAPLPANADGGYADCVVRTVDGRRLDGSLRLLDNGPIPWTT